MVPKKKVVYFATSNPGKIASLRNLAQSMELPLDIRILRASHPEVKREDDLGTIALDKAVWLSDRFRKPVFSTDVGLFIRGLNGFPGVNTAFALDRIGVFGLCKLMEGVRDRRATWECALAYKAPGKRPLVFYGKTEGAISGKPVGKKGFGWDPIFVAKGDRQTFGEAPARRDALSPLRPCLKELSRRIA